MSHFDDQERVDQIKAWWKRYGSWCLGGVLVAMVAISGWQYWSRQQVIAQENASVLYQNMIYQEYAKDLPAAQKTANQLIGQYSHTVYAAFAGIYLATQAAESGDNDTALVQLNWVILHSEQHPMIADLARLRLARVNVAMDNPQAALTVLSQVSQDSAEKYEIMGDIEAALGNIAQAKQAYQSAMLALPPDAQEVSIIQMKLYQLPAAAPRGPK